MKKFLLCISAAALPAIAAMGASQDVTLFGQLYNGNGDCGIYKFSSGTTPGAELVAQIEAEPNCGAVKAGDRFYTFSAEPGDYGTEYAAYVYDASAGYQLITRIGSAWGLAKSQQVLAHDPVSDKIYTIYQESGYYGTESYLGILDISNRTITKVGYGSLYFGYGSTYVLAMAFSPEGELYAVASNSNLYKVNTSNADLTNIGSTGIYPEYEQSMTFAPDGSAIYWAACNDDINALYSLDPATATATKIKDFTNNEEYVTLWVGDIEAADNAPAAPADLAATFSGGALTGTFSFTAPSTTHGGDTLEGEISYEITANGEVVGSGTTMPGQQASCPVTLPSSGLYDFKVTLSNAAGTGDSATLSGIYAGIDTPMGVGNPLLERGNSDSEFVITWDAPTVGAHGGYVDLDAIKYRVRRLPDFEVVSENATSPFVDTFESEQPAKISYEITPYIDEATSGLALTTNRLMTGQPFETPWSEDFTALSAAQIWTVADANNDGHSWEYQWDFGYFRIYDNDNAKDDWLISPYIRLEEEHEYKLTFDVRTIATEELEVMLGLGLEPSDMTFTIREPETIPDTDYSWKKVETTFFSPASGNMHIGFHAMTASPDDALALYIDNVSLEKTGNSGIKDSVAATTSAIAADAAGIRALADTAVEVFTADGCKITSATLRAGDILALPAGLYIAVASDGTSVKAVIR